MGFTARTTAPHRPTIRRPTVARVLVSHLGLTRTLVRPRGGPGQCDAAVPNLLAPESLPEPDPAPEAVTETSAPGVATPANPGDLGQEWHSLIVLLGIPALVWLGTLVYFAVIAR